MRDWPKLRARAGSLLAGACSAILLVGAAGAAAAADDSAATESAKTETWAVHGQLTLVDQADLAFKSPYEGPNSLSGKAQGRETLDVTAYVGLRPWRGGEIWLNPEIDQGFGLQNTLGVVGFPSAEGYKVGAALPYFKLHRWFLRQTIDLGGGSVAVDPDLNVLAGHETNDRIVITLGKISVPDIFDSNSYAHDPRHDFLNWTLVDAGTFDYAADAWGYTVGGAVEWYQGAWTLRAGLFDLSIIPNNQKLDSSFHQFQGIGEIERRFSIAGRPGAIKVTGFVTRGRQGAYADAIALAQETGQPADISAVRTYRNRGGVSLDVQQQLTRDLGAFLRAGWANGDIEVYEFTDADRSLSGGLSLNGRGWGRPGDTAALGGVINAASSVALAYFNAGGLGILAGDGKLPHPGDERTLETYYDVPLGRFVHVAVDYQFIDNPAYNRDRGPVSVFSARLHAQF